MGSVVITAGRLLCSDVRDYLESRKFLGADIKWIEGKGFFERDFTVKGDDEEILKLVELVKLNQD